MPVSKKRKKDGKPVHRKVIAPEPDEVHAHGPEAGAAPAPAAPRPMSGKPANPFISQQRRGSQRGR